MKAIGYFTAKQVTKTKYPSTELDAQKAKADILVEAIDNKYTIWSNLPLKTSRSIKHVEGKLYEVTEKALEMLKAKYLVMYNL